jgi:PIN domain nuclease of toxin-antitoxin system
VSRVLIDTQSLIWFAEDASSLSARAIALVDDRATERLASAASLWEMSVKVALGKLKLPVGSLAAFAALLAANDIAVLPVVADDAVAVSALPTVPSHKDPFDRLIAAQCLRMDLTLVSVDAAFDLYGVRRVW